MSPNDGDDIINTRLRLQDSKSLNSETTCYPNVKKANTKRIDLFS